MILIQIAIWIALGAVGGTILARKGYSPVLGIAVGLFCGPLGLLLAALIPSTAAGIRNAEMRSETDAELTAAKRMRKCPECGRESSIASPVCPRCNYRFANAREL